MPRTNRVAPGGWVFHVLNRGNARMGIFGKEQDYAAFEGLVAETLQRFEVRLLAYCLMPNHWHLVLWPQRDGELGRFMQRLTVTHVRRWHLHRNSVGHGHLYQGLYKSFPIQQDGHFLTVCRYVERNALRANLVMRAEDRPWSSLAVRRLTPSGAARQHKPPLAEWPLDQPRQWLRIVNQPQSAADEQALRTAVQRGQPFGGPSWQKQAAARLSLQATLRPRGRPKQRGKT